jgi:hypothetical protein
VEVNNDCPTGTAYMADRSRTVAVVRKNGTVESDPSVGFRNDLTVLRVMAGSGSGFCTRIPAVRIKDIAPQHNATNSPPICPRQVRTGSTFPGMGAVEFFSIALPAVFWPLVVGLVALTQRKPIGRLIDRVRSGRVFGQEFDAPPPGLAEAAKGGASSPEVEEVIRSVSEGRQALLAVSGQEPVSVDPTHPESPWTEMLERFSEATQNDEDRRRSEIERVMQSSARWGAKVARSRPNDVDDWEPVVRWKDDGEPEIVAIRGAAVLNRRMEELRDTLDSATMAHLEARREAQDARKAMDESPEPGAEFQERVRSAEMNADRLRADMELAEDKWEARRHRVDRI